jgi:uncharacterized membrane protein YeaQ/YmgE (transglycosylase-associated protein family)
MPSWVLFLIIGAIAGWLAGQVMKGGGFGLLGDIVVGVIGAFIGGWVFGLLGITAGGVFGALITAFVGAVILLYLIRLIKKA